MTSGNLHLWNGATSCRMKNSFWKISRCMYIRPLPLNEEGFFIFKEEDI
jgi:hypothetical protein